MILERQNNDGNETLRDKWTKYAVYPASASLALGIAAVLFYSQRFGGAPLAALPSLGIGGFVGAGAAVLGEGLSSYFTGFTKSYIDSESATNEELRAFFDTDSDEIVRSRIEEQKSEQDFIMAGAVASSHSSI